MAGMDNYKVASVITQDTQLVGQTLIRAVNSYNKAFNYKHTICKVQIDYRDNSFTGGVKIHMSIRNSLKPEINTKPWQEWRPQDKVKDKIQV
eukprot:TRINITY_DN32377_c0_g1_i1.p1 TRINITY_DN32377_c0_g1~~TRINITY_DN32377_c0_g1_i1.p1  ORF type:complete len:103 (-),score=26.44 TRINITY_DN32377_c0_g1_i1:455-730(-)